MMLRTLDDVRELMRHLPKDRRELSTWQHVAAELDKAAAGAHVLHVATALRMVLMLEARRVPAAITPRRFPPPRIGAREVAA